MVAEALPVPVPGIRICCGDTTDDLLTGSKAPYVSVNVVPVPTFCVRQAPEDQYLRTHW